ncbi:uncharacterized protein HD556DRAFT_1304155 [Suillus plorans]|uniref:Uncharacterized protein n=1 Tax=Suillus plorans TaxID=116603 RepID=A0A9P7DU44_9AGAM|nr:uncharacterized protein HD556DRAFT_1304155 [Suillus plorans]KAG1802918.1 hypothetical protein HD556DRAFT_1304155 [Suillus plorans]
MAVKTVYVQGWNLVRPQFLEGLMWARTLLKDAEELSTLVTKFEAEEENLSLADQDPEVLDDALFNHRLVWQYDALPGSVYHAHMSIDVTHRDRHSVKTSYFRAPQAMPVPHVTLSVMPPEGILEAFNFDVAHETGEERFFLTQQS